MPQQEKLCADFPMPLPHAQVVAHERPDLQEQASTLVQQLASYTITLKELEDSLLLRLGNAQVHPHHAHGNATLQAQLVFACVRCFQPNVRFVFQGDILEDIPLIENLEGTKRTALDVNEKIAQAKLTEVGSSVSVCGDCFRDPECRHVKRAIACCGHEVADECAELAFCLQVSIAKARDVYRPVAVRGALLYFLIDSLQCLDRVYHFSMANFVYIFQRGGPSTPDTNPGCNWNVQCNWKFQHEPTQSLWLQHARLGSTQLNRWMAGIELWFCLC